MQNVPTIDELRATRLRLAEQQQFDVEKYAAMLRDVAQTLPGDYLTEPLLPPAQPPHASSLKQRGDRAWYVPRTRAGRGSATRVIPTKR